MDEYYSLIAAVVAIVAIVGLVTIDTPSTPIGALTVGALPYPLPWSATPTQLSRMITAQNIGKQLVLQCANAAPTPIPAGYGIIINGSPTIGGLTSQELGWSSCCTNACKTKCATWNTTEQALCNAYCQPGCFNTLRKRITTLDTFLAQNGTSPTTPTASVNQLPVGNFGGANLTNFGVWGWTADNNSLSTSLIVRFKRDLTTGGQEQIGQILANVSRPDLGYYAGLHGFVWIIPTTVRTGVYTLHAYAVDPQTNIEKELPNSPKRLDFNTKTVTTLTPVVNPTLVNQLPTSTASSAPSSAQFKISCTTPVLQRTAPPYPTVRALSSVARLIYASSGANALVSNITVERRLMSGSVVREKVFATTNRTGHAVFGPTQTYSVTTSSTYSLMHYINGAAYCFTDVK